MENGRKKVMLNCTGKPKVAFVCVHNSCRSQIAEALGKKLASDVFESYSGGTELKDRINQDAVRLMKSIHGIDMEKDQFSKLIFDIPDLTCDQDGLHWTCPPIEGAYEEDWGLDDPTGKEDEFFIELINRIESKILELKEKITCKK